MTTQAELMALYLRNFQDREDDAQFLRTISSRNPWCRETKNWTAQMRVMRLDADLAERLKGEAIAHDRAA